MACPPTHIKFQLRRATGASWNSTNPVLQSGEPGFDITTNQLKIGDGVTPWRLLPYLPSSQGPTGPTGPAGPSIVFDGGNPCQNYSYGPVLDCGSVV
uniref:Major tropism determinant N-terminal domain-containing protein n=1 Tax=viral metagenome TaxID=1070528 RepID=A0A6C0ERG2_9ZZZZ